MSEVKFTIGDPEQDFFEQNPHWKYLDSSQKLMKKFSNAEFISRIRWATFLILDPDSKYHRYPLEKRVELVNNNYLKEIGDIVYEPERMKVMSDDFGFVFELYPRETMSKIKRDYYVRERSYQLLVQQERAIDGTSAKNLKDKADVQIKIAKIYDELMKAREEFEAENDEEKTKARGRQQPGIMFGKK